jgi:hypothetical protein
MPHALPADVLFVNGTVITIDDRRREPRPSPSPTAASWRSGATPSSRELRGPAHARRRPRRPHPDAGLPRRPRPHDRVRDAAADGGRRRAAAPDLDAIVACDRGARGRDAGRRWVKGAGYDDNKLTPARHPTRHDLDRATQAPRLPAAHLGPHGRRELARPGVLGIDARHAGSGGGSSRARRRRGAHRAAARDGDGHWPRRVPPAPARRDWSTRSPPPTTSTCARASPATPRRASAT